MTEKLRFLSVLLVILIVLPTVFSACGDKNTATDNTASTASQHDETTAEQTSTELTEADVPERDYENFDFKFLNFNTPAYAYKLTTDIDSDGITGALINDAVYERNSAVEERFNITISVKYGETFGSVSGELKTCIASGDEIYSAVSERLYEVPGLITGGFLYDLKSLPYVNFDNPWWDKNSADSMTILKHLYIVGSDIQLSDKYATAAVMFNKKMAADRGVENIYTLVKEGRWTMDKIAEISSGVTNDLDGNTVMDENDIYGMLGRRDMTTFFFHGAGGRIATINSDGIPEDTFYTDRNITAVQKVFSILYDENLFFNVHSKTTMQDSDFYKLFRDDHCLFYVGCLLDEVEKMRESDLDFGIVPNPKLDEEQSDYYSTVSVHHTGLISVPALCSVPERTGIILEALSAESRKVLQPAYYETALIGKSLRDSESEEMLDIIFGNRVFDVGDIFNFGNFSIEFICISTNSGSDDITSLYEKNKKLIEKSMSNVIEQMQALG